MASKRELIQRLLKGIETGDARAAAVVNEARYIQHNPQTHEGSEGLATLFARLAKTNPKVTFIRVFEDGDFAFAHNEYDFSSVRAAFEVFRFEDGQAIEHWDNIQPLQGPNPSGRGMLDGATEITDLDRTEQNRALARSFVEMVLIGRQFDQFETFVANDLIQHSPEIADGVGPWRAALQATTDGAAQIRYNKIAPRPGRGELRPLHQRRGTPQRAHQLLRPLPPGRRANRRTLGHRRKDCTAQRVEER